MAVIKKQELKAMDRTGLKDKLAEIELALEEEYSNLKTSRRAKEIKYKVLRRTRARIKTLLNQRRAKNN
ncbi:hypothetical protein KJ765_02420 [Candidatus Micrarchaeota archaeon]|nr:hypothetical protein [Candidatus Micrarchaeota archaeon]